MRLVETQIFTPAIKSVWFVRADKWFGDNSYNTFLCSGLAKYYPIDLINSVMQQSEKLVGTIKKHFLSSCLFCIPFYQADIII